MKYIYLGTNEFFFISISIVVFSTEFFFDQCVFVGRKIVKPPVLHAVSIAEKRDNEIAIVVAQFFFFFKYFFSVSYIILAGATSWFRPSTSPIFFHFFPFGSHRVVYLRLEVCLASTHSRMPCQLHFVAENSVQANEMIKRIDIFTWNQISLNLWTRARAHVCVFYDF